MRKDIYSDDVDMYVLNAHIQREGGERMKRGESGGQRERDRKIGRKREEEGERACAREREIERLQRLLDVHLRVRTKRRDQQRNSLCTAGTVNTHTLR